MAEIIELRSEETIPELESMMTLVFDKDDMQQLLTQRKQFEYKMQRSTRRKEDCFKYINFEMRLMKLINMRHQKKSIPNKSRLSNLQMTIGKRLNKLFILTIRWFPSDPKLWVSYLRFCRQMKFYAAGSRVMEQMLELHGSVDFELFKLAADWELNHCNNLEKARKYVLMGIHTHKDNKELLKEAFRLELMDADRKRKDCIENNVPIDPVIAQLTSKKAGIIYDCSIKKLKDVVLFNDLITICSEYDFATDLHNKINKEMFNFENDEKMWDIIATRELNSMDEKIGMKEKIGKSAALYDTAVKRLNTTTMWSYYIDTLLELVKDTSVLPNYKRKLLLNALQKCANNNKLGEKYYLIWVTYLQGPEKHKKLVDMLSGAVKSLPESVALWTALLRVHLTKGEEKQANQVFDLGIAALGANSLPLWKLMLQFEQIKRNNKVEDIFKKSWTQPKEVCSVLKPMYLEWLVLTQGIVAARKLYDVMYDMIPPCLEMHKKMVHLETMQPTLNLKRIRQSYTLACVQFGAHDVDVWLDFCKFESNSGDPDRVSDIYWRARRTLSSTQFETFHSEISLIRTIPPLPPTK